MESLAESMPAQVSVLRLGDGSFDLRELMRLIAEDVVLLSTRLHSKSKGNRLLLPGNSGPAHREYRIC